MEMSTGGHTKRNSSRGISRPKARWVVNVQADLSVLNVQTVDQDRTQWEVVI